MRERGGTAEEKQGEEIMGGWLESEASSVRNPSVRGVYLCRVTFDVAWSRGNQTIDKSIIVDSNIHS